MLQCFDTHCRSCGAVLDDSRMTVACQACGALPGPAAEPVPAVLHIEPDGLRLRQQSEGAAFTFHAGDRELLRIDPDGTVYRDGREIGTDEDVFRALQRWARALTQENP